MEIAAKIMIAFVAIEHLYILYIEMFAWETIGKRTFRNFPSELFTPTKALAANQGLYNGFLSAGLIWSLFISDSIWSFNVACFFLSCVLIAAIYGAFTASKRILVVQGAPALLAMILLLASVLI